jgi:hypothetical protein
MYNSYSFQAFSTISSTIPLNIRQSAGNPSLGKVLIELDSRVWDSWLHVFECILEVSIMHGCDVHVLLQGLNRCLQDHRGHLEEKWTFYGICQVIARNIIISDDGTTTILYPFSTTNFCSVMIQLNWKSVISVYTTPNPIHFE